MFAFWSPPPRRYADRTYRHVLLVCGVVWHAFDGLLHECTLGLLIHTGSSKFHASSTTSSGVQPPLVGLMTFPQGSNACEVTLNTFHLRGREIAL